MPELRVAGSLYGLIYDYQAKQNEYHECSLQKFTQDVRRSPFSFFTSISIISSDMVNSNWRDFLRGTNQIEDSGGSDRIVEDEKQR
jgi:hypothetical protein